jgi:hypothetical protein
MYAKIHVKSNAGDMGKFFADPLSMIALPIVAKGRYNPPF